MGRTSPQAVDEERVLRAFGEAATLSLTGLTQRQLRYWDRSGFARPSVARGSGRGSRRLYSFPDLVALRVAGSLRREGVPLPRIRKVVDHLKGLDHSNPLAQFRFWSYGGEVYFEEAATTRAGRRPEQTLAEYAIPLAEHVQRLDRAIEALDRRTPGRVERRRATLGHKPVFQGTRIPLTAVQRMIRAGVPVRQILELYPALTEADVEVAAREAPRPGRRVS